MSPQSKLKPKEPKPARGVGLKPWLVEWRASEFDLWGVIGEASTWEEGLVIGDAYRAKFDGYVRARQRETAG